MHDRAALVFVGAANVDARTGWARFGSGGSGFGSEGARMHPPTGDLVDEGGAGAGATGMQLWIHATPGHQYVATCRVRLKSSVGEVIVRGEAGFQTTTHLDHSGKPMGKVSFLVDPIEDGWYAFSIAATQRWSTTGCWVEEI